LPGLDATSHLSAHNKFGTISPREFYWKVVDEFGVSAQILKELYWREFFTHVGFWHPFVFERAFNAKFADLKWENDEIKFDKWKRGRTGFPIVDAGMRELNETGFMHNRVRMIVASFLIKDLHVDWRLGEQYFAQKLVDYDPAVNNGNWQWVAGTGCDAAPYFRIFNPWLQQKKFDPDCVYIKKWIPELRDVSSVEIHGIEKKNLSAEIEYPRPMINHGDEIKLTREIYGR